MKNKVLNVVVMTVAMVIVFSLNVWASNTYAENGAKWVLDGIFWVTIVAGVAGAAGAAIKRNTIAAVGIILAAAIVGVFCKNPELFTTLGNVLKGIIGL